jgi:hypothetical protein
MVAVSHRGRAGSTTLCFRSTIVLKHARASARRGPRWMRGGCDWNGLNMPYISGASFGRGLGHGLERGLHSLMPLWHSSLFGRACAYAAYGPRWYMVESPCVPAAPVHRQANGQRHPKPYDFSLSVMAWFRQLCAVRVFVLVYFLLAVVISMCFASDMLTNVNAPVSGA